MSGLLDEFMKRSSAKGNLHAPQAAGYEDSPVAGVIARDLSTNPFAMGHYAGAMMNRAANIERYSQDLTKTNALQAMLQKYITDSEGKGGFLNAAMKEGYSKAAQAPELSAALISAQTGLPVEGVLRQMKVVGGLGALEQGANAVDKGMQGGWDISGAANQSIQGYGLPPGVPAEPPNVAAARVGQGPKMQTTIGDKVLTENITPEQAAAIKAEDDARRKQAYEARTGKPTPPRVVPNRGQQGQPTKAPTAQAPTFFRGQEPTGTDADTRLKELMGRLEAVAKQQNVDPNVITVTRVPGEHAFFVNAPNNTVFTVRPDGWSLNP